MSASANDVREAAAKTVVFTPRVTIAPLGPDTALHMPATLEIHDVTPPELVGAQVSASGDRLILTYDVDLDLGGRLPPAEAFTVEDDGDEVTVQSVAEGVGANDFILNLLTAIGMGQTVTVSYTVPSTNAIRDLVDGIKALPFTDRPVVNNSEVQPNTAPVFDEDEVTFEIAENQPVGTDIGDPVTAKDAEGDDLEYSLADTPYAGNFSIDAATGQLRSDSLLDFEDATVGRPNMLAVLVVADDGRGGTAQATVVVNVTDVAEPPLAPEAPGVSKDRDSVTSLMVTWKAPDNDGRPEITHYDLRYRTSRTGTGGWMDGPQDQTGTSATIGSLVQDTEYQVQVRASNADGDGPWSETGTVDGRGALLTPTTLIVDEGTTGSYTVELTEAPTGTVRVTIAGHAGTDVSLSRTRLTFTSGNWDAPQTVSVTADEDGDAVDDTVTLTHTVSTGGGYDDVTLPDLEVTVADNDGGISADPAALTVAEGGTGSYVLTLTRRPTSPVTVTVTGGAGVTVDMTTLTFTATDWDVPQTVTVTAVQDSDKKDAVVTLRHAATGGGYAVVAGDARSAPVAVTVHDAQATAPGAPGLQAAAGNQSATLRWTPPGDDGGAPVTGYEYSRDGGAPVVADGAESHTVGGLENGTDYAFRLRAVNRIGRGAWSAAQTVRPVPRTLRLTPSALVVDEGTSGSYTVELTEAPTGTVRVTIAGHAGTDVTLSRNRLTFTTTNWDTPQTVMVTASEDSDAVDDTVTLTYTVSGGGYDGVMLPDLEVTVADNDGGIVAVPASLTVAEGGTGSYVLTLTRRPTSPVTVTVAVGGGVTANPATLTFTAGNFQTVQTVNVTAAQDSDRKDAVVTLRHAATGGGYAVVAGDARSAPVAVTVHDAQATAPGAPGLQAAAGNQSATLRWTPPNDDGGAPVTGYEYRRDDGAPVATDGAESHTVGGLENGADYTFEVRAVNRIGAGAWSAAKTVRPVPLTLTVEAVNENEMVTEGDPVVYRIVMSNRTAGVSVGVVYRYKGKFLSTEPSSTVTGIRSRRGVLYWEVERETVDDAEVEADGKFTVRLQPGDGYTLGTPSSVTVTILDNDGGESPSAPGVTVSKPALTVAEEDATGDSYTVVLDTQPTADVTVTVAGHAGTDVTPSPTSLTFTTSNWDTARTVTVTAGDDTDTANDTVLLTHSATSADNDYNGIGIAEVTVTVNDNDTAQVTGVSVAPGNAQLAVSWTQVDHATGYKVQWKSGSEGYNTGDRQATVTPGSTTSHTIQSLTNGAAYTVQVIATRTGANDGPPSAEMTGTPAAPTTAGVTVSKMALTVAEEDTDGDSYTVVLDIQPTADVTVTVAGHAGTDVTPAPATLTFTPSNWDTAQTVTVTAADDTDTTDDTVTLTHSATSADSDYSGIVIAVK